jgi:hypothetical protein
VLIRVPSRGGGEDVSLKIMVQMDDCADLNETRVKPKYTNKKIYSVQFMHYTETRFFIQVQVVVCLATGP